MDDAQFDELKARVDRIESWMNAQTGQASPVPSTRSILAQQALAAGVTSIPAGFGNPGPYRVYRMNVPALPDGVDPENELIWQVIGRGGVSTGFVGTHADADAEVARLVEAAPPAAAVVSIPPGPANPGPYTHNWTVSGAWEVVGAQGVHTGFVGTQEAAEAEAKRLNDAAAVAIPAAPVQRVQPRGPYVTYLLPDGRYEVRNAGGTATGFVGTQAEAQTEAARLNALPA